MFRKTDFQFSMTKVSEIQSNILGMTQMDIGKN